MALLILACVLKKTGKCTLYITVTTRIMNVTNKQT